MIALGVAPLLVILEPPLLRAPARARPRKGGYAKRLRWNLKPPPRLKALPGVEDLLRGR